MAKLDAFFKLMFDTGASDLHIVSGQPPILRVHGEQPGSRPPPQHRSAACRIARTPLPRMIAVA